MATMTTMLKETLPKDLLADLEKGDRTRENLLPKQAGDSPLAAQLAEQLIGGGFNFHSTPFLNTVQAVRAFQNILPENTNLANQLGSYQAIGHNNTNLR